MKNYQYKIFTNTLQEGIKILPTLEYPQKYEYVNSYVWEKYQRLSKERIYLDWITDQIVEEDKLQVADDEKEVIKTMVYNCSQYEDIKGQQDKEAEAISNGYTKPEYKQRLQKYKEVMQIGTGYSNSDFKIYPNASVLFTDEGRIEAIMPARCTRKGYRVSDSIVLVK